VNLFVTDYSPIIAAQQLDNKRVGKLLIEAVQLLSTTILLTLDDQEKNIGEGGLCKLSHQNHPVAKWVRNKSGNYGWTFNYACALDQEFKYRFGKYHKTGERLKTILWYYDLISDTLPPGADPFCNCARNSVYNLDYTHLPVSDAYQRYLNYRWKYTDKSPPTWTNRKPPEWYNG
jgi:hypothetical protein